ncbi:sigma-70 family RNA polymerase sigma factor [Streptomyces sp. RKND-216]|uniref:sigma-70 family RNA polymerase sigma factor n=1 Tax=Streptomyces sp. RKND-216 TaxID=2562581 RepID=UPI00109E1511|nr:sigma-70 family RNA polymerase sigma factor [Streptomyces sp. RKND-216]THA25679.1 sigma-70 family RNA polymerase sigma factor [Streptomyces sp. RKND-216]
MGVEGDGQPSDGELRRGGTGESTVPPVPGQGGPVDAVPPGRSAPPGGGDATTGGAGPDGAEADQAPAGRSVPQQREWRGAGRSESGGSPAESDSALLRRMRGGDTTAYETLYHRHAAAVRRYARTCCRDAHTAEDLTNEVFARTLQAVRAGAGPDTAVRAYLLTSVRRVAAAWARTAKREHLVEDFAAFAQSAAGVSRTVPGGSSPDEETLSLGADVRAMQEADRTMAVRAFRSLPEKYQTVLWHTTVEEESPRDVAPLLGLSDNATAVLAHRAREKLKQAYLQAHVNRARTEGGACARYADRLGAYARGGLRMRAERGLRRHLETCAACRTAALEVVDLNAQIRLLVPVAFLGWFGAAGGAKALGLLTGGGAVAGAAATGGAAGAGAAGGGAVAEGVGAPVKIGVAAGVVTAAGVAVALTLIGDDQPAPAPQAKPSVAPAAPSPPPRSPQPAPEPEPPRPAAPVDRPGAEPPAAAPRPAPGPSSRPPRPQPAPEPPAPSPPSPTPTPTSPPPAPETFRLERLGWDTARPGPRGDAPTFRAGESSWLWQRYGGVRVPAPSSVTVDLNRSCTSYDALARVDRLTLTDRAVRFAVFGDGSRLWQSQPVRRGATPVPVRVPLTGVRTVRLVVQPVSPQGPADRLLLADWADARISCR